MATASASKRKRKQEPLAHSEKRRKLIAGCAIAEPEAVGLSRAPLDTFRSIVKDEVHKWGTLPGVAHLVLVNGKCVFAHADGCSNMQTKAKFGVDTLCALHSCTKPLVVAAFLTLVDEGKVRLTDHIDRYVTYSHRVAVPSSASRSRELRVRPTLHHLVTQVAGLRHSDEPAYKPILSQLKRKTITNVAGLCDAIAEVPLQTEPGALHYYSWSIDVLGRVCEVVSGKNLEEFVTERILQPLGMKDTHFGIPSAKLRRKASLYNCKRVLSKTKAKTKKSQRPYFAHPWHGPKMDPGVFSSGGGILSYDDAGMYSTAEDYARFCLMLVNGGKASSGRQVLRQKTVRMLFHDSLTPFAGRDGRVPGWNDYGGDDQKETFYWDRHAWSLINATLDLESTPRNRGPPRKGNTLWMYGMGAYWLVDVRRKLVAVSMAQCFSSRKQDRGSDCVPFVRQAIEEGSTKLAPSKPELYYGKEEWKCWIGQAKKTAAETALSK